MRKSLPIIAWIFFIIGFIYIILPGPGRRDQIPSLPDSVKSIEPGDTYQNPNNAAYYSDHRRNYIRAFYSSALKKLDPIGAFFPPIRLNYPPEEAYTYVRDQEKSTFLEEYVYPLRESIFVNGYEPLIKNGRSISHDADFVESRGLFYNSKTVIRLYPSSLLVRILIYLGISTAIMGLFKVGKKVFKGE